MTKITKMVMHGFKSFAKHTELSFGNSFNCVLGPNGSGKSNILDALCFVLGRTSAKSLRAEKAANLVYNGGKLKKGAKQGEVSLYFDNSEKTFPTEDNFVKITRIIKKTGQSVYKINDEKRTRQQIIELMHMARIDPDGFNIVLQGDIVKFTEMHPEQRRQILEEISGISVYEDKKQKAIRELEKVEDKLKEADIVLAERKSYLKELKKDRDHALKFKELKERINESKASYLYIQIDKKSKEEAKLKEKIENSSSKIKKYEEDISAKKQEIDSKKKEIEEISKEIEEKSEKERIQVHHEIEELKVELAKDKTRVDTLRGEIDKIKLRREQLEKDLKEHEKQITDLEKRKKDISENSKTRKELKEIEQKIKAFKEKNKLEDVSEVANQIEKIDKKADEKQKEIEEIRKEQQDLLRKKDSIEFQINNIDEKIDKVKEVEKEHKSQIESLKNKKKDFKKTIVELNKKLNDDSGFAKKIGDNRSRLKGAEEQLAKLEIKSASIGENISGNTAVRKVIEKKQSFGGIFGTISELGSVNSKYSIALEIAAGARMNSIVVDNDKTASKCINYLKENKLGTATFLPLNKINPKKFSNDSGTISKAEGSYGYAIDLVSFDNRFRKAFEYVFGDSIVVEDIDTARKLGIGKARMVTLEGDYCDIRGAMQGGYRKNKSKGLGFQKKEITKEIDQLKGIISSLETEINDLEKERANNEEEISKLRERKATLEGEIIKDEKSLHLDTEDLDANRKTKDSLSEELKETEKNLDNVQNKVSEMVKELTSAKIKKQELRNKMNQLRNPRLMAELNAFEDKRNELQQSMIAEDGEVKNIDSKIKDIILPEKEKIKEILKQSDKESEDFTKEIKELLEKISGKEKDLDEKEKASQEFYAKNKQLFARRNGLNDQIYKIENKVEEIRSKNHDEEIKMNKISLDHAKINAELSGFKQEFSQYEGVKINNNKSEDELKKDINKFERMAQDIGNVNMRALEVYEDIEKEYNGLLEKKDKLVGEKDEVMAMMDEIEEKKKDLFVKTYDAVNENFKKIFSDLSTKGDGSLILENEKDPLEGGLNIKVRLSGTKYMDIRSLSGGEKTMTALAFIFAIQEYEPHKFYIMDEVDAALDKRNSEKLAKLVRKYCDKAQYVVISHNDQVISEADNLYGISMNEHGVSNVTSLRFEEAQALKEKEKAQS